MGAGIAQVALEAGHRVLVHDVVPGAAERARDRVADGLRRRAAKAGLAGAPAEARVSEQLTRLERTDDPSSLAAVAELVIEAAIEDLGAKRELFSVLDRAARPGTILATNTSALSIAAIAAAMEHPERALGLHFFNPAPLMALVEVVSAPSTAPAVAESAVATMAAWAKTPIRCADSPGFIVNRVNRPFTLEALRALEAGSGRVDAIDAAVRAAGYRMGPFEYMDLVGIDVNLAAAGSLYQALGRPARLRPSPIQEALVAAGRVGRKSGSGFYRHATGGGPIEAAPLPDSIAGWAALEALAGDAPIPAGVAERIALAIANEAYFALDAGVASAGDIDRALRLGANHPWGPFEWARQHGEERVLVELEALVAAGQGRFEPAPGLRAAVAGRSR